MAPLVGDETGKPGGDSSLFAASLLSACLRLWTARRVGFVHYCPEMRQGLYIPVKSVLVMSWHSCVCCLLSGECRPGLVSCKKYVLSYLRVQDSDREVRVIVISAVQRALVVYVAYLHSLTRGVCGFALAEFLCALRRLPPLPSGCPLAAPACPVPSGCVCSLWSRIQGLLGTGA